jgi:hypothetical protein
MTNKKFSVQPDDDANFEIKKFEKDRIFKFNKKTGDAYIYRHNWNSPFWELVKNK